MRNTQDTGIVPSDTTYAATLPDGTGLNNFVVETSETNASLGCTQSVACSLVIIPIEGVSCDPAPALANNDPNDVTYCQSTGAYKPGEQFTTNSDTPVSGSAWFLASNWANRVSVPLTFAPPSDICSLQNHSAPLNIYGSELMAEATAQWNPTFCLAANSFNVNHIQTSEPEAKNLLNTGAIEAAFQGLPPQASAGSFFNTPTAQAPVAVTGFAISYVIDNGDGKPYQDLKLDARLLAKLMTESYPGDANNQSEVAVQQNPLTLFRDPEFLALNPSYKQPGLAQTDPAATLFSISAQSDVLSALTSYMNADPDARAWLDGKPDPWGMVVNPAYKGIQLPVPVWYQLDTYVQTPAPNPCLAMTPVPNRPFIDSPQLTLAEVAINLQFGFAPSIIDCTLTGQTENFVKVGTETRGDRFMIGVIPLSSARAYALDTAALQSYVTPGAPAKFTNPAGRVFVAPDEASLKAAADLMQPSSQVGSWQLPYTDFSKNASASPAYPGTMLVSMDVPTSGLPKADAADLAQYLSFAAASGQTPGAASGELPDGYLPMTSANGLGNEVAYTQAAAVDVAKQNGQVPPLVPQAGSGPATTVASNGSTPAGGSTAVSANPPASGVDSNVGSSAASSSATAQGAATHSGSPAASAQPAAALGRTLGLAAGLGGLAVPLAFAVTLGAGAVGVLILRRSRGSR